jgi:pimeloyl-ACP methyl ester carboxylesterase
MLYNPANASALPRVIHRAAAGDLEPITRMAWSLGAIPSSISAGFYLSSTCSEDLPWVTDSEAEPAAAGTFLGTYRYRQQRDACAEWPRRLLPAAHLRPVQSGIPTLILVGEYDPVTPPRWAREISRHLSRSRVLIVPGGGHGFQGLIGVECIRELTARFYDVPDPGALDASCLAAAHRPVFLPKG